MCALVHEFASVPASEAHCLTVVLSLDRSLMPDSFALDQHPSTSLMQSAYAAVRQPRGAMAKLNDLLRCGHVRERAVLPDTSVPPAAQQAELRIGGSRLRLRYLIDAVGKHPSVVADLQRADDKTICAPVTVD